MELQKVTIAIQAGGQSRRMGEDKGLVLLNGEPMIRHVLNRVSGIGDETIITTNNYTGYTQFECRLVPDHEPGAGALPGLLTALRAAHGRLVLVVACDMPFLHRNLLSYQLSLAEDADIVVPYWNGYPQPLHAVYRRETCLPAVQRALAAGKRRMTSFYADLRVCEINESEVAQFSPEGLSFFNANTPEELAQAEKIFHHLR